MRKFNIFSLGILLISAPVMAEQNQSPPKPAPKDPAWITTSTDKIIIYRTDPPACVKAKKFQIKLYSKLSAIEEKGCEATVKSCENLKATLTSLSEKTNKKIVASCVPPWMQRAAGLDADGVPNDKARAAGDRILGTLHN